MTTTLNCPSCGLEYPIPDLAAIAGRKVRCRSCAHVWRVEVEAAASPSVSTIAPEAGKAEARVSRAAPPPPPPGAYDTGRTIALDPALSAGAGRRLGRRRNGFDDVEAAIAALQSSVAPASAPASRAPAFRPPPAANGAEFAPLSSADPLEDSPFAADAGFEQEVRSSRVAAAVAWVAFLAVLGGLGAIAWFDRVAVVRALPGSAAAFSAFGAPVNTRGLEFSGVDTQWQIDGRGRPVLSLTGQVRNVTSQPQVVPSVVFAFLDQEGRELFDWATPVRVNSLPPGETMPFTTVVPAPPEAVRGVEIRFAKASR